MTEKIMNRMPRNSARALLVAPMALLAISCVMRAEPNPAWSGTEPQAAASGPDLSGVWLGDGAGNNRNLLLQPAMPLMQPWVKAKFDPKGVTTEPDSFLESCDPLSAPRVLLTNTPEKIVQTPGEVVLLYERNHDFREVYTDGRQHPKDLDASWWGHSIGRWDGSALVVDTVGFNDKTWLDWSGLVHTEALHLVERYQRVDHDNMRLDITVDDPKAYTQTFAAKRMFKLKPWDIGEDICTHGDEQHFRQGIVQPATAPSSK
jgi:hypothetical protein